jgi:DNA-binding IclR family transcriptional regulator
MRVRQAANVLDLFEYFGSRKRPATLAEISEDLGWPRSSTFNILDTLTQRGYLFIAEGRFGYYPTEKWLVESRGISEAMPVPDFIRKAIQQLAEETGETAYLAAPAGLQAVLIYVVESKETIRYSAYVGKLLPIHTSAVGRAILSQFPKQAIETTLAKVEYVQYQPNSLMSREAVLEDIERSEKRGWFESNTQFTPYVQGLAVKLPVLGRQLAIAIGGPTFRIESRIRSIGELASEKARQLIQHASAAN